ncbi:MAG: hypothetical protein CME64_13490 [Halobacteriovoraceae bacterium]|nr:hypothetical protein [Halobacteriovoraceae bacterium]
MKLYSLLIALVFSLGVFADTSAYQNFTFDGSTDYESFQLNTEKTKTEYRYERVRSTCYRTEYRRRCGTTRPHCRTVCRNGNCRRVCPPPRRVCRQVPVQVPYSCMRTVRRAYEVFDYYVDTKVNFEFSGENMSMARENFRVKVSGSDVDLNLQDSGKYLVLSKRMDGDSRMSGDVLEQEVTYKVELVEGQVVTDALEGGVRNVSLNNGIVRFTLGSSFNTEDFIQNLKVYRSRRIISDILLLDRNLDAKDMEITQLGQDKVISVDLNDLGVDVPGRTRIILTTTFDTRGLEVLNPNTFKTEASANWIFSK